MSIKNCMSNYSQCQHNLFAFATTTATAKNWFEHGKSCMNDIFVFVTLTCKHGEFLYGWVAYKICQSLQNWHKTVGHVHFFSPVNSVSGQDLFVDVVNCDDYHEKLTVLTQAHTEWSHTRTTSYVLFCHDFKIYK